MAQTSRIEPLLAISRKSAPGTSTVNEDSKAPVTYRTELPYNMTREGAVTRIPLVAPSQATFRDSALGTSAANEDSKQLMDHKSGTPPFDITAVREVDDKLEVATIFTQASNDSIGQETYHYETDLAARLYHELRHWTASKDDIARVSNSLPRILQTFAFKIEKERDEREYRDTKRFMLKHRGSIAKRLWGQAQEFVGTSLQTDTDSQNTSQSIGEAENLPQSRKSASMSYEEKIAGWNVQAADIPELDLNPMDDTRGPHEEIWESERDKFSKLVTESRAYQWLLAKLKNELELRVPIESAISRLSEVMFRNLHDKQPFSRESTPQRIDAVFDAEWSPHSFFNEQEYGVPPEEAVVKAFVLVGTTTRAEGLACGDYLLRQWPETARAFIRLLQLVVKSAEGTIHCKTLVDNTLLQASIKDGRFILKACGYPDSVIEIGEQLMWISCALRSSQFTEVGICEPSFGEITTTHRSDLCVSMHIKLAATPKLVRQGNFERGACWQELFRNPLVVGSNSIRPSLSRSMPGLQLSISTLMALIPGSRLVSYMGKLFIKAFSVLLVAMKLVNNAILWHTVSNKDGSYVYYHDKRIDMNGVEVTSSLLQKVDIVALKHIVGWTSNADNLAGTQHARYQISLSGLVNRRPLEVELEKFTIGFSKVITGNGSIKFGWRDKPIHARDGEDEKRNITHISQYFVVLYDVGDHRAFLLDGASALLHLVRTSIVEDQKNGLIRILHENQTVNDSIQLDDHLDPKRRSMNALWKEENARLRLYKRTVEVDSKNETKTVFETPDNPRTTTEDINSEKDTWVLFKNRVMEIWWMLDQAINMQTDDTALKTKLKSFVGTTQLEGYDFKNLASSNRAHLRFATPRSDSKGWLDLVRRLPAVTLFGRGFGDVIQHNVHASNAHPMCPSWKAVPTERGYLAMSSATLEDLLECGLSETWRLQNPFEFCKPQGQICDRSHFLVSTQTKKAQKAILDIKKHGAVIIGHESSTISKLMNFKIQQDTNSNEGATVTSRTSARSQSWLGSQSEDRSRPDASSSGARSGTLPLVTASETTIGTHQNNPERCGAAGDQRSFETLATPNVRSTEHSVPSEVSMNARIPNMSQSMESSQLNTSTIIQPVSQRALDVLNSSSDEHNERKALASNTVVAGSHLPCAVQSHPNHEKKTISRGQKQSIRERFRHIVNYLRVPLSGRKS